jgi:hypothetical protein
LSKRYEENVKDSQSGLLVAIEESNNQMLTKPKMPGRRLGKKNKRTEEIINILDTIGAHPEIFLANVMMCKVSELDFMPDPDQRIQAAKLLMQYRWPKPVQKFQAETVEHKVEWKFEPNLGDVPDEALDIPEKVVST